MLGDVDLDGGHFLGLVALRIGRIADALVVVERWHAGGERAAGTRHAGVRAVVDVGAGQRLGDDGQRPTVDFDLVEDTDYSTTLMTRFCLINNYV